MPKIIVVADLHIDVGTFGSVDNGSLNSAWKVAHRVWLFSVQQAIERKVDAIAVIGDIFHTGHPWVEAIQLFKEGLDLAVQANMPVILVGGNHELSPRQVGHRHILEQFNELPNVYVIHSAPASVILPGCNLVAVPWPDMKYITNRHGTYNPAQHVQMQRDWLKTHLDRIAKQVKTPSFLVGHLMMDKAKFGDATMEQSARIKFPSLSLDTLEGPWTASMLGHIHLRQQISDQVGYAGCPWTIMPEDARTAPRGPSLLQWDDKGHWSNELLPGPDRQLIQMDVHTEQDVSALTAKTRQLDDTSVVIVNLFDKQLSEEVQQCIPDGMVHDIRPQVSKEQRERTNLAIEYGDDPIYAINQWTQQERLDEDITGRVIAEANEIWTNIKMKALR